MKTDTEKKEILRLSNEESNRITKEALQTALIELMAKKSFEDITITELVKRSGVSRTAFYRNYNCKEDIVLEFCNNIINLIKESIVNLRDKNDLYEVLLNLFTIIKNDKKNFNILLQAKLFNSSLFPEQDFMEDLFDSSIKNKKDYYTYWALSSSIYSIVKIWFENGMKEDVKFMANICIDIYDKFDIFN